MTGREKGVGRAYLYRLLIVDIEPGHRLLWQPSLRTSSGRTGAATQSGPGKVEICPSRHSGHVRMVRCRASCSSAGSPSPVARDTPRIVPISALAGGHDHPPGVTTSPAVRSTMDTLSEVFTRRVCPGRRFRSVDRP
jgi:hypothetical protein